MAINKVPIKTGVYLYIDQQLSSMMWHYIIICGSEILKKQLKINKKFKK